jgi:hypothetical protein
MPHNVSDVTSSIMVANTATSLKISKLPSVLNALSTWNSKMTTLALGKPAKKMQLYTMLTQECTSTLFNARTVLTLMDCTKLITLATLVLTLISTGNLALIVQSTIDYSLLIVSIV